MSGEQLRTARRHLRLTQEQAAQRWRVSQAYLSLMEHDRRRVPVRLARLLAQREPKLAFALPLAADAGGTPDLPALLGSLGYPGFAYLADRRQLRNPAAVVLAALEQHDMPARVAEALPWVMVTFPDLNWTWLVERAKAFNLQNRLGYLASVAQDVADQRSDRTVANTLQAARGALEEARLAKEDSLRALTEVERRHLRTHRPPAAAHWNLLTALRAADLRYGA